MTEIKVITQDDFNAWDKFVAKSATAGFFHRTSWLRAVQLSYGHKHKYLMAVDNDSVVGILPLFLIEIPLGGCYLASDVFTSYGGVSADNTDVTVALLEKSAEIAKTYKVKYVEIKNTVDLSTLNSIWKTKKSYCTMKLDLSNGSDEIWKAWRDKTRNSVRKAMKSGVTISRGAEQMNDFYNLVAVNMKYLGTPVHSRQFYQNILDHFPDDSQLYIARHSGKAIAGIMTVSYKNTIQSYASVAIPQYRNMQPTPLLYWDIIQHACELGSKSLDFGRSTWDSGTYQFKERLGGIAVPLFYGYYLNKQQNIPEIHQENSKFRLAVNIWQRLPLSITKLLGPRLIKYVA